MYDLVIFHIGCPAPRVASSTPAFRDMSRPKDPTYNPEYQFYSYKCDLCGAEISVRVHKDQNVK